MKKRIAVILATLVFTGGNVLAEASDDDDFLNSVNFEMFYTEMGLPYDGVWTCFDNALYIYLPSELKVTEVAEQMRSAGMLAEYHCTDAENITTYVQISKQGEKASARVILKEIQAFCTDSGLVRINGIPVAVGHDETTLCAETLMPDGEAYLVKISFSSEADDIGDTQGMYLFGIVYSLSETPLEIDEEKVGLGTY